MPQIINDPAVRSLDSNIHVEGVDSDPTKLLVGCGGGDLVEITLSQVGSSDAKGALKNLVSGHSLGEVWGLATHPLDSDLFATCGDDMTLRVFSKSNQKLDSHAILPHEARALAWIPTPGLSEVSYLIVGFGTNNKVKQRKQSSKKGHKSWYNNLICIYFFMIIIVVRTGSIAVYRYYKDPEIREMIQSSNDNHSDECSFPMDCVTPPQMKFPSTKAITEIKVSPDGRKVAVGSHDRKIYVMDLAFEEDENGWPVYSFTNLIHGDKHNATITHFDFSSEEDGTYLQSNCQAYELLFWSIEDGSMHQVTSASSLRDVDWSSWTCTLGWPVQGIWPPCADGTDANAVDRSYSGDLVATGDDFGKVKIFRYPCVSKSAQFTECNGHSSHVTNVRWLMGDNMLISTGGNDKSVICWIVEE